MKTKQKTQSLAKKKGTSLAVYGSNGVNEAIDSIVNDFKRGVDYDVIVAGKKPVLLIPGADKVTFKFNLMATFKKDTELLEMTQIKGAIAFICELIDRRTGKKIGEGRGASIVGNGKNCESLNGAIKMAEIRAERDAVLRTFALRERFTQDLEELNGKGKTKFTISDNGKVHKKAVEAEIVESAKEAVI